MENEIGQRIISEVTWLAILNSKRQREFHENGSLMSKLPRGMGIILTKLFLLPLFGSN